MHKDNVHYAQTCALQIYLLSANLPQSMNSHCQHGVAGPLDTSDTSAQYFVSSHLNSQVF